MFETSLGHTASRSLVPDAEFTRVMPHTSEWSLSGFILVKNKNPQVTTLSKVRGIVAACQQRSWKDKLRWNRISLFFCFFSQVSEIQTFFFLFPFAHRSRVPGNYWNTTYSQHLFSLVNIQAEWIFLSLPPHLGSCMLKFLAVDQRNLDILESKPYWKLFFSFFFLPVWWANSICRSFLLLWPENKSRFELLVPIKSEMGMILKQGFQKCPTQGLLNLDLFVSWI